jgi:hypothetical protein
VREIKCGGVCQDSIEQRQHFCVGQCASTEQNDTRTIGLVERHETWIVEIGGDDHAVLAPRDLEQLAITRASEPEIDGVDRLVTGSPQVPPSVGVTGINVILDKSGSMGPKQTDVIGGIQSVSRGPLGARRRQSFIRDASVDAGIKD